MSFLPKQLFKITTLVLIFIAGLAGCSSEQAAEQDVPMSLTEWLDAEYEEQLMRSPMNLTYLGRSERCLLYTSPSPRDRSLSRMPSSA